MRWEVGVSNARATQILAHRGASRAQRENTVAAFRTAHAMGSHGVELDVRRTADDALVVHHDPRLADGRVIRETPAAALGEHIAHLSAALDACAGMWVNLEIKNDDAEPDFDMDEWVADQTMALLAVRGEPERWLMSSFRLETMNRCRELAPHIRTAWLVTEVPHGCVHTLTELGHHALHPWVGMLDRKTIEECHDSGIQVNTWTCDDPQRMRELIDWGIDGICTNVPDVGLAVLASL